MPIKPREIEKMATHAAKLASSAKGRGIPPRQPDYQDEVSKEQLEAIRRLVDPDCTAAGRRTLLHSAAW